MPRLVKCIGIAVSMLAVLGAGACFLLPERFAVNVPLGSMLTGTGPGAPTNDQFATRIRVPDGFSVGLYATDIENARFLRFTSSGDLLVSQPRRGEILLLERDRNGDGLPDGRRTLLSGLDRSLGLDLDDGWLYIGEGSAVARVRFDAEAGTTVGDIERIVTGIPEGGNHWTRTLRIGPDGHIYLSVGSSCNVCEESDPRRAAMLRYRIDGSGEEIYAAGMRNSVGFDWRPGTNELYATDNGRDLLGDDFPPCELNRIERGGFYGWPYANGDNAPDPDFGAGNEAKVRGARAPDHDFRAHNAPLGMTFVRGDAAPGYRGAALVALHGSWNRSAKDGYKVVSLHWPSNGRAGPLEERDFLWGLEVDDDVIGRPVDVIEGPDGAFYISDDYANSVYRVAYGSAARATVAPGAATTIRDPLAAVQEAARPHLAATGSALYARHACATCHDPATARPGVVSVVLEDLATRYDVPRMMSFLAAPTPPMPAFDLTEDDRRALAVHLLR